MRYYKSGTDALKHVTARARNCLLTVFTRMPSQRAERGKKPVAYLFFVVFIFIFFLHGSRKPVMNTLIEPGLKPD